MRREPAHTPPAITDFDAHMQHLGYRGFYEKYGFIVLRNLIPLPDIERLQDAIASEIVPFKGRLHRHGGKRAKNQFSDDGLLMNALEHPHSITEPGLQGFVRSLRAVVFHPRLADTLESIDGHAAHVLAQTALFFVCPHTRTHIDSFSLDTWPRGHAHTCWIPLEDVQPDAGPPYVYPAQTDALHIDFTGARDVWEADNPSSAANEIFSRRLAGRLEEIQAQPYTPALKKGDVILWNSLTPHGSMPPMRQHASRKAIQALYWPQGMRHGTYMLEKPDDVITPYNARFAIRAPQRSAFPALRGALSGFKAWRAVRRMVRKIAPSAIAR